MKTFKIILICIFSATLAFVAFRSSLRGTKAIYETTQPQYREIKEEILVADPVVQYMNRKQLEKAIERTKKQMMEAAKKLDFIEAAQFRDELVKLEDLLVTKKD